MNFDITVGVVVQAEPGDDYVFLTERLVTASRSCFLVADSRSALAQVDNSSAPKNPTLLARILFVTPLAPASQANGPLLHRADIGDR